LVALQQISSQVVALRQIWAVDPLDALIILAGGSGSRLDGPQNKVYAPVLGRPLLWYPLRAAASFPEPVRTVVVFRLEDRVAAAALADQFGQLQVELTVGGPTRHESERAGLDALAESVPGDALIGIHDGARPFLTVDLWQACVAAARQRGGAVPVLESGPLFRVESDRLTAFAPAPAYRAQTPQVFRADILHAAFADPFQSAADTAATVMRHSSGDIAAVPGDPRNLKVTVPADLERAERLARSWSAGRWLSA
jgi:2-C-methyl-D-erythritol 4-phosphate cytidylyltransferase